MEDLFKTSFWARTLAWFNIIMNLCAALIFNLWVVKMNNCGANFYDEKAALLLSIHGILTALGFVFSVVLLIGSVYNQAYFLMVWVGMSTFITVIEFVVTAMTLMMTPYKLVAIWLVPILINSVGVYVVFLRFHELTNIIAGQTVRVPSEGIEMRAISI